MKAQGNKKASSKQKQREKQKLSKLAVSSEGRIV